MKSEDRYIFIGKKIKEAREEAKFSQKQLADSLGFESATAISLIESGERRISVEDLEKVAEILHKDISYFLGYKGEKADIHYALRADKNLTTKDKEQILGFINFIKSKKNG